MQTNSTPGPAPSGLDHTGLAGRALRALLRRLMPALRVVLAARVGLLVAAIGIMALTFPMQTKDMLSDAVLDVAHPAALVKVAAFCVAVFAWSAGSWFWVRWAVTLERGARSRKGAGDWTAEWLPRLVAAATGAGAVYVGVRANGFWSATAIGAAVVMVAVVALAFLRGRVPGTGRLNADRRYAPTTAVSLPRRLLQPLAAGPFGAAGTIAVLVVSFVAGTALGLAPVRAATPLGAGAAALLALACVTGAFSLAIVLATRITGLPVITLAAVAALAVALLVPGGTAMMQVDHQVRKLGPRPERIGLQQAARDWLLACAAGLVGPDGRAKITVVSTAGGASRAALWTAGVLAAMEREDPLFPRRVFAISAVSGGALGAGAWVAALHDSKVDCATDPGPSKEGRAERSIAMLGRDFLAPVMARWVLVDVAYGAAFPFNLAAHAAHWVPADRAAALEQAWETAWREEAQSTTFAAPFTAMWGERQARHLPLLFLNGTMRESGLPVVTAPVTIGSGGVRATHDALDLLQADVALSTAVTNAARFPYITPNGVVRMKDAKGVATELEDSIVDGGYFDNLGAGTLMQVVAALRAAQAVPEVTARLTANGVQGVDIAVVQINSNPDLLIYDCVSAEACLASPAPRVDLLHRCGVAPAVPAPGAPAANTLDAQLAPILSIIATQTGHTLYRFAELSATYCDTQANAYFGFSQCTTGIKDYPSLALNWVLPRAAREALTLAKLPAGASGEQVPSQMALCGNPEQFGRYRAWLAL